MEEGQERDSSSDEERHIIEDEDILVVTSVLSVVDGSLPSSST